MNNSKKYRIKDTANNINNFGSGELVATSIITALMISSNNLPNYLIYGLSNGIVLMAAASGLTLLTGTILDSIYEHIDKNDKKLKLR